MLTEIGHLPMTRPWGAAAGGARARPSPCAARRPLGRPLSALPAPELPRAATSPECSQSSHPGSATAASSPHALLCGAAGLPDQLRKGGEEWEGLDPDRSLRPIGNQPFLHFQRGCQKKI